MTRRKAALFLFIHVGLWQGMHVGAWRDPDAPQNPVLDLELIKRIAQTAERGKFHGLFLSDILALPDNYSHEALSHTREAEGYEPFTLTSVLSTYTEKIGLACTANTTYNEPYHIARKFASLDHLTGGRIGWNIVAGGNHTEAKNFSLDEHVDHSTRYARAQEFVDVTTALWDSWDDDAFPRDKESGQYFDVEKMHQANYKGEFFSVAGPITIPRSPQGYPVIAQAGSSTEGLKFATKVGDIIFTHTPNIEQARQFYTATREQVAGWGRNPDDALILPALTLLVRETTEEADEALERLDNWVDPSVSLKRLAFMIDFDLSEYPLDGPVPEVPVTTTSSQTQQAFYLERARVDNLTVRQLAQLASRAGTVSGSASTIADRIEEWVTTGASDGFIITVSDARSLEVFVDLVVPELQRRGVYHDDYEGTTLRDYLGLERPASRYEATDVPAGVTA